LAVGGMVMTAFRTFAPHYALNDLSKRVDKNEKRSEYSLNNLSSKVDHNLDVFENRLDRNNQIIEKMLESKFSMLEKRLDASNLNIQKFREEMNDIRIDAALNKQKLRLMELIEDKANKK
jgi:hypothetical protein